MNSISILLCLLIFSVTLEASFAAKKWQYADIDEVLMARNAIDLGPDACIQAAKDELAEVEALSVKTDYERAKIEDLKLFISLEEVTKPESCNEYGSDIMRNNELKLEGRQWLARFKWEDTDPTMRVVVHFANQHSELCQMHYLARFKPKWETFNEESLDYIEAITTPLIDSYTPNFNDPQQQKLAKEVKSWTMADEKDPVKRSMYNKKAISFQSVNTADVADIMRQVIVEIGTRSEDPQVACLKLGFKAKLTQTVNKLTFRHKCDLEKILTTYVDKPCKEFLNTFRDPLEFVSYDLLLSKQVMDSENQDILDMHLAAGRARICHLLAEEDRDRFIFSMNQMTGNLPSYYYVYG